MKKRTSNRNNKVETRKWYVVAFHNVNSINGIKDVRSGCVGGRGNEHNESGA